MNEIHILEAIGILQALGFPRKFHNARAGLALLAVVRLTPSRDWPDVETPQVSVRNVAAFPTAYDIRPRPDTAELLSLEILPAFQAAGLLIINPDAPSRPSTSPHTVYQVPYPARVLLRAFGSPAWASLVKTWKRRRTELLSSALRWSPGGYRAIRGSNQVVTLLLPHFRIGWFTEKNSTVTLKWRYF